MSIAIYGDWPEIINSVYHGVLSSDSGFISTLARTLDVYALFQNWLSNNNGPTLYEKVESILNLWKDQKNNAVGDITALIQFLRTHQKAHSCEDLILRLEHYLTQYQDHQTYSRTRLQITREDTIPELEGSSEGSIFEGTFKVQLHRNTDDMPGEKIAAQRFKIKTNKNTILGALTEKICSGFKELGDTEIRFDLFWKDSEDDFIRITDNENLIFALEEMKEKIFRIYVINSEENQREDFCLVNSNDEMQRRPRISEHSRQNFDSDQSYPRGLETSDAHRTFETQDEDWEKITNLITPGNLRRLGNPSYETLASYLDVLNEYLNGPAKGDNDETKLNSILNMWKRRQTDQVNLASNFVTRLELSQRAKAGYELYALISQLKKQVPMLRCKEHSLAYFCSN